MNDLETKLCRMAAHEQDLGVECGGRMSIVEDELLIGTFAPLSSLPKSCVAYEWFGDRQFKCQYATKNMLNVYCMYEKKHDINYGAQIVFYPATKN